MLLEGNQPTAKGPVVNYTARHAVSDLCIEQGWDCRFFAASPVTPAKVVIRGDDGLKITSESGTVEGACKKLMRVLRQAQVAA
jgi:hypothetical protein